MPPQSQVRLIRVQVEASNKDALKAMAKDLGGISREVKTLNSGMGKFNNILSTVMGASVMGFGIKNLVDMSDSFQILSARINVLTGGTEDVNLVMSQLNDMSRRTKTSLDDSAESFSRVAATTRSLGVDTDTTMRIVEALQNTFRISGTRSEEATGALIQFTQALGLGKFQGQEFRSVMLANVTYAELLAKSMGVTRGELQRLAEAGKITVDQMLKPLLTNFDMLQSKGEKLGQTIGQTLTLAFNEISIAVGKASQDLGISSLFAKGMDWLLSKLGLIGAAIIGLAVGYLPMLGRALMAFAVSNPLTAALTAIILLVTSLFKNLDEVKIAFYNIAITVGNVFGKIFGTLGSAFENLSPMIATLANIVKDSSQSMVDWANTGKSAIEEQIKARDADAKSAEGRAAKEKALMEKLAADAAKAAKKVAIKSVIEAQIAAINQAFNAGKIGAEKYFDLLGTIRLKKLNMELEEGKSNIFKLNEALNELQTQDLTRKLNAGRVGVFRFHEELNKLSVQKMEDELKAGTLTVMEFDSKMLSLQSRGALGWNSVTVGVTRYLDKVKTLGEGIATVVEGAFDKLDTAILEMTKTGKYNFADFTQAVLDDLAKIVMRAMIIAPLAKGLLQYIPGSGGVGSTPSGMAEPTPVGGAQFQKIAKFANGGIINRPSPFLLGGTSVGVMGESGPEAIMPLSRGPGGQLGIAGNAQPVVVNIINQSGSEVQQTERTGPNGEKTLDILIVSKVKDAIATGMMDKTLQQAFGLRRMGY